MGDADMRLSGESGSSTLQSRFEVAVLRNHGYARGTEYRRQTMLTGAKMAQLVSRLCHYKA